MNWKIIAAKLHAASQYAQDEEHKCLILEITEHLLYLEMPAAPGDAINNFLWWRQMRDKAYKAEQEIRQNIEGLRIRSNAI